MRQFDIVTIYLLLECVYVVDVVRALVRTYTHTIFSTLYSLIRHFNFHTNKAHAVHTWTTLRKRKIEVSQMCFNKFEAISPLAEKNLPLLFAFDHVTFSSLHIQWRKVFFYIYPFECISTWRFAFPNLNGYGT